MPTAPYETTVQANIISNPHSLPFQCIQQSWAPDNTVATTRPCFQAKKVLWLLHLDTTRPKLFSNYFWSLSLNNVVVEAKLNNGHVPSSGIQVFPKVFLSLWRGGWVLRTVCPRPEDRGHCSFSTTAESSARPRTTPLSTSVPTGWVLFYWLNASCHPIILLVLSYRHSFHTACLIILLIVQRLSQHLCQPVCVVNNYANTVTPCLCSQQQCQHCDTMSV